jgi:hypothetical protein
MPYYAATPSDHVREFRSNPCQNAMLLRELLLRHKLQHLTCRRIEQYYTKIPRPEIEV